MSSNGNPLQRFLSLLLKIYRGFRSLVLNLLFLVLLLLLLTPLIPEPQLSVPDDSALLLNPKGNIVEQAPYDGQVEQLLDEARGGGDGNGQIVLQDMLDVIDAAATDAHIKAIVLRTDDIRGGGFSALREIGAALQKFRATGKKVYAWGDSYSQAQYYLASHADVVTLNPMGGVELSGLGSWQVYYKNALDKLGVHAHIFRVGEYKAAVEPYERNDMSPAARENYNELLGELWKLYVDDVAAARKIDAASINDMINHMDVQLANYDGDSAKLAQGVGLVDRLESRPQTLAYLQEELGRSGDSFRRIGYRAYLNHIRKGSLLSAGTPKIGVIVASGEIKDGSAPAGTIGGDTLAQLIREARDDDRIKGLVLRVDSPGGSAFASEIIRGELESFRASGRPVVISMSSLAASGGYWISTQSDEIFANPATITGSIGIFGVVPTFEDSFAKLGLNVDGVGTTELSGVGAVGRGLTPMVERSIQAQIDSGYAHFLSIVAASRDMSTTDVDKIAQGRVWTGAKAKELGLVDELCDPSDAVDAAARLANLSNYESRTLTPRLTPFQQLLKEILNNSAVKSAVRVIAAPDASSALARRWLHRIESNLQTVLERSDRNDTYVRCFECENLVLH